MWVGPVGPRSENIGNGADALDVKFVVADADADADAVLVLRCSALATQGANLCNNLELAR